jgi:hypothetical protein
LLLKVRSGSLFLLSGITLQANVLSARAGVYISMSLQESLCLVIPWISTSSFSWSSYKLMEDVAFVSVLPCLLVLFGVELFRNFAHSFISVLMYVFSKKTYVWFIYIYIYLCMLLNFLVLV